jgi:hypothetical protein
MESVKREETIPQCMSADLRVLKYEARQYNPKICWSAAAGNLVLLWRSRNVLGVMDLCGLRQVLHPVFQVIKDCIVADSPN